MGQAGPQRRVEPGDPAEGDVEMPREDLGRGAGQAAVEAGHELHPGGGPAGGVQHPLPGRDGGADVDDERPVRARADGGGQVLVRGQHAAGVGQQPLALGGERHLAGAADEQRGAPLALQAADVAAEGLLGHVEAGGGAGEVELLGDGGEGAQQPWVGVAEGGAHGRHSRWRALIHNPGA
jgi:hypothetical protein